MTNEPQLLTVKQLIEDLQKVSMDAQVFVSIVGAGLTIPIVGMSKLTTEDNKELVVFGILAEHAGKCLEAFMQELEKQTTTKEVIN